MMELHMQLSSFVSLELSKQVSLSGIFSEVSAVSWYFQQLKHRSNLLFTSVSWQEPLYLAVPQFPHLRNGSSGGCLPL